MYLRLLIDLSPRLSSLLSAARSPVWAATRRGSAPSRYPTVLKPGVEPPGRHRLEASHVHRREAFGVGHGPAEPIGQTATEMLGTEIQGLDALIPEDCPSSLVTITRGTSLQPPIYRGYTLRITPTRHTAS
jgi:hypothetical protein